MLYVNTGVLNMIALIVFGSLTNDLEVVANYWSFGLACCSCIILLADGVVFFILTAIDIFSFLPCCE